MARRCTCFASSCGRPCPSPLTTAVFNRFQAHHLGSVCCNAVAWKLEKFPQRCVCAQHGSPAVPGAQLCLGLPSYLCCLPVTVLPSVGVSSIRYFLYTCVQKPPDNQEDPPRRMLVLSIPVFPLPDRGSLLIKSWASEKEKRRRSCIHIIPHYIN